MKKYKVTQEFIDALNEWNDNHKYKSGVTLINEYTINELPEDVLDWLFNNYGNMAEKNKKFGAIINWINGEDVFEIITPKYIVQRKEIKFGGKHEYLYLTAEYNVRTVSVQESATRFYDFNEASGWSNKHFEVVEVDE